MCHSNSHFSIYAGTSFYYFACSFQKADATSQKSGHQDVQYLLERCLLDAFIVRNYKKEKCVLENITGRHLHDKFLLGFIPVRFFILGEGSCVIATKVPNNLATEHLTS